MFNKISKKLVFILCSISLLTIFICSLFTVCLNEYTKDLTNNIWLYLILFVLISILFFVFIKYASRIRNKRTIYIIFLILIFIIPILLVIFASQTNLEYDCKDIFNFTFESLNGDYRQVFKGNYMSTYTWQYGLSLFQTIILKIANVFNSTIIYNYSLCIKILFYVNAVMTSTILLFGFLTVKNISNNEDVAKLSYVFLSIICIPFFLYALYLYTDIPSICFVMISTYLFVKYIKTFKYRYCLLSILFMCLACIIRLSLIVFAIAFMLVMLYNALIEKKHIIRAIIAILFLVLPILSNKLPLIYYENVSNYSQNNVDVSHKIGDGCPVSLNIAMGIDVNSRMYGWYTGKNYDTCFNVCNHDLACETVAASTSIKSSLKTMSNSIPLTLDFFSKKLISEWGDGTMEAFFSTKIIGETVDRFIVNLIYKGNSNIFLHCFAKGHIILVYLLSCLFIIIKRKIDRFTILDFTLEIIVLGGFILSIFWETGGRYNLPYLYVLIILASTNVKHILSLKSHAL